MSMGSPSAPAGAPWRSIHRAAGVLDGLIHWQDEAGCLRCCRQSVDTHDGGLPDTCDKVICDVFVVDVHTVPHTALQRDQQSYKVVLISCQFHLQNRRLWACVCVSVSYLCVLGTQFVQNVCGIKAGVVTQLSGDDLQGLGVRSDQQLLFSRDGPGIIPQVLRQLHLHSSSTCYNGVILKMDSIVSLLESVCTDKPINRSF